MKLIYVAGPYSANSHFHVKKHIDAAEDVAVELWRSGFSVICPHKNTAFLDGGVSSEMIISGDLEQIKRCDAVVFICGYATSKGTLRELKFALDNNIPIFYWGDIFERMLLIDLQNDKLDIKQHNENQKNKYKFEYTKTT